MYIYIYKNIHGYIFISIYRHVDAPRYNDALNWAHKTPSMWGGAVPQRALSVIVRVSPPLPKLSQHKTGPVSPPAHVSSSAFRGATPLPRFWGRSSSKGPPHYCPSLAPCPPRGSGATGTVS